MADNKSSNDVEFDYEVEHARAVANNADNIKNAAEVAKITDIPEAVIIGEGVSALDKITDGASTEMLSEAVTDSIEKIPYGEEIQEKLNDVNESGIGDTVGTAASLFGGMSDGGIDTGADAAGFSSDMANNTGGGNLGTSPNGYGNSPKRQNSTNIPDNRSKDSPRNNNPKNKSRNSASNNKPSNNKASTNRPSNNGRQRRQQPNERMGRNGQNNGSRNNALSNDKRGNNANRNLNNNLGKRKEQQSADDKSKTNNSFGGGNTKSKASVAGKGKSKKDELVDVAVEEAKKRLMVYLGGSLGGCALIMLVLICILVIIMAVSGALAVDDSESNDAAGAFGNGECGFTISATSLSRDEFVKAITDYSSKNSINKDFVDHAGDIYDKANSMNINPELVVVRAIAESGATKTTGTNNYWGMGCTNNGGGKDCKNYSSFMDGVTGYLKNISKYSTLNDMMSHYSYLGGYWYNPGDAGQGGCYYSKLIFETIPTRVKNACASDKKCSGSKCVKTTAEEQEAYTKWQVEKNMASIREKVFGLKASEGVACTGGGDGNFSSLSSYNLKHAGLKILSKTLSSSEISSINNFVNGQVQSAGYGTGAAVAAAGQSLAHALSQKGYYLGYCFGGDRSSIGAGKSWGKRSSSCNSPGRSHHYYGMDCSGFVSWSIRNACKSNFGADTANGFRSKGSSISIKNAKPGDLMASSSHVRLIVKNNGDGSIIVAEESSGADGLIFNKYSSAGSYKIVSMSSWYSKHCKK